MAGYDTLIRVGELRQHIGAPKWRVVDCRFDLMRPDRGRQQYLAGHIPGAVFADLDRDLAGPVTGQTGRHPLPDAKAFAECLGGWGIGNSSQVVVYDQASGALAARLWWLLRWSGHDSVAVLDGGLDAWCAGGGELSDSPPEIAPATFIAATNGDRVITTGELQDRMRSGAAVTLVDARDRARFLGHVEPIDTLAGHIPGARNFPFSQSLDDDGHWRSADELRGEWLRMLTDGESQPWVAMCGSGVTACHLALSAKLAGFTEPRLYVGSWSEWIRDPSRPVASEAQSR